MPIIEIVLSAVTTVLFERLASLDLLKFARSQGILTQVTKLRNVLRTIQAVLNDAETKQIRDEAVNQWLAELRDLAYDVDDLVDEIATEAFAHELKLESEAATTSRVRTFLPTCCSNFPRSVGLKLKLGPKIEEITARLQDIAKLKDDLGLRINPEARSNTGTERMTASLVDEPHVYGREKDKQEILGLLLNDESSNDEPSVIPIVGMGGLGKTTLAQLVYNEEKVEDFFDLKVWVCVSEEFDVLMITNKIYGSATKGSCDFKDLDTAQVSLKEKLSGKKFLLVLDDVWNLDYVKWDLLRAPFRVGAPGSKIIVTTRDARIALTMGSVPAYNPKVLGDDDCLSLLAQHALCTSNFGAHPNLEEIGLAIMKKCGGLPLAAKTLGGILRSKRSSNEWKDVLDSEIWDLPEDQSGILPALRLSYHHLPSQLKPMFGYCAIFPKDYWFDKDELVLLWMAEGFLQQPQRMRKRMEELGDDCFNELLSRSFFQLSSNTESKFTMHDLLNDLAQHVTGEICFRLEDNMDNNERCRISPKARHSAFMRHNYEVYNRFKAFDHELLSLRTFLALPFYPQSLSKAYLSNSVLVNILPKLPCLRVLSLSVYTITELPNLLGDLKHLRFLNLSRTHIEWLPESVGGLYNLQTLLLRACPKLCKLPTNIGNLVNLHHLDNANTPKLQGMPAGISMLKSLQTLPKFVVCKSGGLGLSHLNNLELLRGMLSIVGLQNVKNVLDAEEANLNQDANINRKRDLDELELLWSSEDEDSQNEVLQANVLNMLRPHKGLKHLKIEFYRGLTFPSWIGDLSFLKTTQISLRGCTKCESLPPLGQLPLLKELHIQGLNAVKNVGAEFYKDGGSLETRFPLLETLSFEDMPEWEGWCSYIGAEFVGHFPCLRQLTMSKCPKLVSVSVLRLPSLHKLKIEGCREVVLKGLVELTSLRQLFFRDISGLTHLQEEFTHFLVSVENFEVCDCAALVTLWQKGNTPQHLSHLQHLSVEGCSELVCLTEEDQMLPRNLESLRVSGCDCLERLPNGLESHTSLKVLKFEKCPKLVSFPEANLPPMLRSLWLTDCSSLESLPNCNSCLEELHLEECASLRSLPMDTLSSTLTSLEIRNCKELESILEPIRLNMEEPGCFRISDCPNLKSLRLYKPDFYCSLSYKKGQPFPTRNSLLTPNLRELSIGGIVNDISFASKFQSLTSLEQLWMTNCDNLESFPQENLPPNLTHIWITNCKKLKPLSEWGLHRLSSLRYFGMSEVYPELHSLPDECWLPSTLTSLLIGGMPNLTSLSKGIHNLTSLNDLYIKDCPILRSLPDERTLATLSSLDSLYIEDCPNLRSLPDKRTLATLSCLSIRECPLLEQRCLKDKGADWHKIADIPYVQCREDCFKEHFIMRYEKYHVCDGGEEEERKANYNDLVSGASRLINTMISLPASMKMAGRIIPFCARSLLLSSNLAFIFYINFRFKLFVSIAAHTKKEFLLASKRKEIFKPMYFFSVLKPQRDGHAVT
ncbi:unnamed protein product [Ilex paraguariensis]|uniref:Disease resistance RPP13-like protein 1 n=2 Tax=Ilex paraguariensis TaxID=185542 RepID=A0ABC8URB7_9AQUA